MGVVAWRLGGGLLGSLALIQTVADVSEDLISAGNLGRHDLIPIYATTPLNCMFRRCAEGFHKCLWLRLGYL
jgi:hypothetical protein